MVNLGSGLVVKFMGKFFPFIVRKYYPPERLEKNIDISINPQDQGVHINAGQGGNVSIWLKLTNLNPFAVELDRISGFLSLDYRITKITSIRKAFIKPSQSCMIYLESFLSGSQAEIIKSKKDKKEVSFDLYAYFNCNVSNFTIERSIKSKNIEIVNAN